RAMLARERREREGRRAAAPRPQSFDRLIQGSKGPFAQLGERHGPPPESHRPAGWKPPRQPSAVDREEQALQAEERELAAALDRVREAAAELRAGAPLPTLYERLRMMCGDESAAGWLRGVRDDAAWIAEQADALLDD
ncbi:MAG: hypothetical protein ACRDM0_24845, partial [Thermoleophilaceae bacterium]